MIPFECNHFPPQAAALAQNRADSKSLSSRGQKRSRRAAASLPWTGFPLQVEVCPAPELPTLPTIPAQEMERTREGLGEAKGHTGDPAGDDSGEGECEQLRL